MRSANVVEARINLYMCFLEFFYIYSFSNIYNNNSWDDKVGNKGFFLMNDSWFAEYMFEIAVPKEYLPPELQKALELEPIVLPAWDPMGSLAKD